MGPFSFIADSRSHYNRKLRKCFVPAVTAESTVFSRVFLFNGYENTSVLWWGNSGFGGPRLCYEGGYEGDGVVLDCDEAQKRLNTLMGQ